MNSRNCSKGTAMDVVGNESNVKAADKHVPSDTDLIPLLQLNVLGIVTLLLQITNTFLFVTSLIMFVKHKTLQKRENTYHVTKLVSTALFLLCDGSMLRNDHVWCEIFSLASLLFGSASSFSSLGIAWDRFRRMSKLFDSSPRVTQYVVGTLVIWIGSLSTIALPLYGLIETGEGQNVADSTTCFLQNELHVHHSTLGPSLYFLIVSVLCPSSGMLICYVKIFRDVKSARISRWINQASAEASRKTVLIKTGGRKANIVAIQTHEQTERSGSVMSQNIVDSQQTFANENMFFSAQEKSILAKGVVSVFLVLSWLPFSVLWVVTSASGFQSSHVNGFQLLMLLVKVSSVLQILHYVVLNSKFRKFYFLTVFSQCKNRTRVATASRTESNLDADSVRSRRVRTPKKAPVKLQIQSNLETISEISTIMKY